jgi:FlaA1/EpsC-like NDP-sugar epimerase
MPDSRGEGLSLACRFLGYNCQVITRLRRYDGDDLWIVNRLSERTRRAVQLTADCATWILAILAGLIARYELAVPWGSVAGSLVICIAAALIVHVGVARAGLLYRGRYRFGSFEEVAGVARVTVLTAGAVLAVDLASSDVGDFQRLPVSVPLAAAAVALLLMAATRYLWRSVCEHATRTSAGGEPLIVFGAGDGGFQIVRSMLLSSDNSYLPVALLDDDPGKQRLRLLGLEVQGGRQRIAAVAAATGARNLLVAIPSADARLLREITDLAEAIGVRVKVLPPVSELFERVGVEDIRDIDLVDLLGRRQVETDVDAIAGYVTGRRVMVTGAGGSIGSELCRQIFRYEPAELMMLDRDESALHAVQLSIHGRALLDSPELILADLRDAQRISGIFDQRKPEVIFHAAALKHLTLLERYPGESIKTNVWGTLTVLKAAEASGARLLVNISTDKAANPISVLGYSKRITERLTAMLADRERSGRYLSVRFGNVLGSRGSVLTTFTAQVAAGGPITLTHPDVTRYFMTVQESVQLVIQAGAIGRSGETLVLDMGDPVRIGDVAQRLASQSSRHVEIVHTGLRPGEKLHEVLLSDGELDRRPEHPLISHVCVPPLAEMDVELLDPMGSTDTIARALRDCATLPKYSGVSEATQSRSRAVDRAAGVVAPLGSSSSAMSDT